MNENGKELRRKFNDKSDNFVQIKCDVFRTNSERAQMTKFMAS